RTQASLDGISIELYNENGERVYGLNTEIEGRDYQQKTDLFTRLINPIDLPAGSYKMILRLDAAVDGRDSIYYIDTGRYLIVKDEQDYDVDAIKGEGYSYERIKEDPEGFVDILVKDGAVWGGITPITEDNRQNFVDFYKRLKFSSDFLYQSTKYLHCTNCQKKIIVSRPR
ncbi:MAG: hypothetical protein L3J56_00295, partial [Bacteroidales bacterium]|nr:hypothetical protein [Bacteroidales bacterium]